MDYLVWSEIYSVNVPHIDSQHQKLFEIINDFHRDLKAEKSHHSLTNTFNQLVQYAEMHFKEEEELLAEAKYPGLAEHQLEHEKLLVEIFELNSQHENFDPQMFNKIVSFLNKWLVNHILGLDKEFAPHCVALKNFKPKRYY